MAHDNILPLRQAASARGGGPIVRMWRGSMGILSFFVAFGLTPRARGFYDGARLRRHAASCPIDEEG